MLWLGPLNKSELVVFAFLKGVRARFPGLKVEQTGMNFVVLRGKELLVSSGWLRGGFELRLWSRSGGALFSHRSLGNSYDLKAYMVGELWVSLGDPDCFEVVCGTIDRRFREQLGG